MNHVYREALVPYSAQQMYDLVNNTAEYPQFLPWCKHAHILTQTEEQVTATLLLAKSGIHKTFTTKNTLTPFELITIELVDGPFKHLQGQWRFNQQNLAHTLVALDLKFEFSSKILALLLGAVFNEVAQTLVSSFTQEAHRRYGAK